MFQSNDFFKHIDCPFFKHDLCHRPYCHFKHIKSKKEKGKVKEGVTENSNAEAGDSSVVENNAKKIPQERSPSPVDDVNEEILKIITKYKSHQEAPSPIDEVNDEILKIVMKYKSHEEAPPPADGVNDEILKIVMKYKSKQETSSSADMVTDDILNIVKNISPSKLIEYAKRKQEVQELQWALDQVDEETKKNPVVIVSPEESTTERRTSGISAETARSEEDIRRGLIDSFYSKAKVQVNITSGDLVTKPVDSPSSKEKVPTRKKMICNCDDPECSGFREESDDNHFTHTSVNLNEIEDEYMRRKMQKRLERKKKILTQSETFSSVLPGTDETFSSILTGTSETFSSFLPGTEIFSSALPGSDEMLPLCIPGTDETLPIVVPGSDESMESTDIQESDFFVPPTQTSVVSEPEEHMDDDLSKYIDKCKEEYAKKRMGKLSTVKKTDVIMDATPCPENNLSSDIQVKFDSIVEKRTSDKERQIDVKKTSLSDVNLSSTDVAQTNTCYSENEVNKDEEGNVDKNTKKGSRKRETLADKAQNIDVGIKKKKVNNEDNEKNSSGGPVQVKKKRRIILPVEEGAEPLHTKSTSSIEAGKTKDATRKQKVTFEDKVCGESEVNKSDTSNKSEKDNSDKKTKVDKLRKLASDKCEKDKPEKNVLDVNKTIKGDGKSHKDIPVKKIKVENKNKSENVNSEKKLKVSNSSKCDDSKSEKDNSLKKSKVDNCRKSDLDKSGKNNSDKKVKTNSVKEGSKKTEKDNIDKKVKTSVANKSSKSDIDEHGKSISDRKTKLDNSAKQNSINIKQEKDSDTKVKIEDSKTLNYFDTHERDHDHDTIKNYSEKRIKTNDSKKQNNLSNNLTDSGKILENTSKEKKIYTEKDISIEMKKKRTRTDSEDSNLSRNVFDAIAISSDDEQSAVSPADIHASDEHFFPEDDHDGSSDDDVCKSGEKHTSIKEDIAYALHSINSVSPGEVKKRIALTNEEIRRRPVQPHKSKSLKMSYVSPVLKSTSVVSNCAPIVTEDTKASSPSENMYSKGKKRVSHVKSLPVTEKEVDDRPKLEMDIGGKIPHSLRQKYFDKIIDELIPKLAIKKEAYEKAISDESDAYKRSTRKPLYMNLCANIVKRIRGMPDYVVPKEQPKADPMRTGQPTTKSIRSDVIQKSTKPKVDKQKSGGASDSQIKASNIAGYQKVDVKGATSKVCIKPASSVLVNAVADKALPMKRARSASLSLEAMELTEDNFYEHMQKYLLTKEQLWEHKYPKRDNDNPEMTVIRDYVPSSNNLKRLCCRCGKEYFMNKKGKYVTRNECHYHWGKLLRQRGRNANAMVYTCCGGDSGGATCAMCRLHVSNKVGPLLNYVSTESCVNKDARRKVFALDCEMCYTTQGLELTRLTVIDFDLEQIIDLFIKPTNPIVDYNTRFSGVTREDLQDVTTSITDIHDIMLNMLDKDTILMGHSLESDLNALNIIHEKAVDTSVVFPHRMGLPLKRALRNLMVEYLQKVIQSSEGGHDSCEDARSCMELMKYKFKEDQKIRKRLKLNSSNQ